jgi:hypothetical protein
MSSRAPTRTLILGVLAIGQKIALDEFVAMTQQTLFGHAAPGALPAHNRAGRAGQATAAPWGGKLGCEGRGRKRTADRRNILHRALHRLDDAHPLVKVQATLVGIDFQHNLQRDQRAQILLEPGIVLNDPSVVREQFQQVDRGLHPRQAETHGHQTADRDHADCRVVANNRIADPIPDGIPAMLARQQAIFLAIGLDGKGLQQRRQHEQQRG